MNKSIFERIFPHPTSSVLPHYEDDFARPPSSTGSSNRISLRDSSRASPEPTPSSNPSRSTLQSAPLSASVVHHDDPFLPVERAARSLEKTLQRLLDAQSDALEATLPKDHLDDVSSVGSPTPTPSTAGTPRHEPPPKLVPIRQPKPKTPSLRSARRGLTRTMEQFATLKAEELKVIAHESRSREAALQRSQQYTDKRAALTSELQAAEAAHTSNNGATTLRAEAAKVQTEIHALETRLFELRTRHRHLVAQADQHDNAVASKLSSYKYSLAAVDRDVRHFLRHPPVPGTLAADTNDESLGTHGGMYALHPGRRTLEMAAEQWGAETAVLARRRDAVLREQRALRQGAELWRGAAERIAEFERFLRRKVRDGDAGGGVGGGSEDGDGHGEGGGEGGEELLVTQLLNDLIALLQRDYAVARGNQWNLLLVCLGAELAALRRARTLLTGVEEKVEEETEDVVDEEVQLHETDETETALDTLLDQPSDGNGGGGGRPQDRTAGVAGAELLTEDDNDSLDPPDDLLNGGPAVQMPKRRDSAASNQSLQDTLRQFAGEVSVDDKGKAPATSTAGATPGAAGATATIITGAAAGAGLDSEDDDDDPGPDFFVSRD